MRGVKQLFMQIMHGVKQLLPLIYAIYVKVLWSTYVNSFGWQIYFEIHQIKESADWRLFSLAKMSKYVKIEYYFLTDFNLQKECMFVHIGKNSND